jgi:hypothetical protein
MQTAKNCVLLLIWCKLSWHLDIKISTSEFRGSECAPRDRGDSLLSSEFSVLSFVGKVI